MAQQGSRAAAGRLCVSLGSRLPGAVVLMQRDSDFLFVLVQFQLISCYTGAIRRMRAFFVYLTAQQFKNIHSLLNEM